MVSALSPCQIGKTDSLPHVLQDLNSSDHTVASLTRTNLQLSIASDRSDHTDGFGIGHFLSIVDTHPGLSIFCPDKDIDPFVNKIPLRELKNSGLDQVSLEEAVACGHLTTSDVHDKHGQLLKQVELNVSTTTYTELGAAWYSDPVSGRDRNIGRFAHLCEDPEPDSQQEPECSYHKPQAQTFLTTITNPVLPGVHTTVHAGSGYVIRKIEEDSPFANSDLRPGMIVRIQQASSDEGPHQRCLLQALKEEIRRGAGKTELIVCDRAAQSKHMRAEEAKERRYSGRSDPRPAPLKGQSHLIMYTDGSAKDGKAGSAVVVLLPDGGDEPNVVCTFMRRVLGAGTNGA